MLNRSAKSLLTTLSARSRSVTTISPTKRVYTRPKAAAAKPTAKAVVTPSTPAPPVIAAVDVTKTLTEEELLDPRDTEHFESPPDPLPVTSSSRAAASSPSNSTFPAILNSFSNGPPIATSPPIASTVSIQAQSQSSGNGTGAAGATYPVEISPEQVDIDWSKSYHGLSSMPFSEKAAEILMRPLLPGEIEIKPDGLLYLPEILYRRILNKAFGPGGWGMVPRGELTVLKSLVSREWGLLAGGRLVSIARGEQQFFNPEGLPTATEGCKSNALMRCCKDLGIASELWDPAFIRTFKATHCVEAWTEHASTKKKARRWRKKGNKFEYPLIESK